VQHSRILRDEIRAAAEREVHQLQAAVLQQVGIYV